MKVLKFKLTIAILCSIAIAFTACSKEEIETSNPISANDITGKQVQNLESINSDKSSDNAIIWDAINETTTNESVASRAECRIKICVDLGSNSTYTVYGAPQTFTFSGPYFGCVWVPFNNGEARNVYYSGTGGVDVYQVFKYSPISILECPLWNVAATNSTTHKSTTIRPHCQYCP